jgi:hypothetical protein
MNVQQFVIRSARRKSRHGGETRPLVKLSPNELFAL